jgi:hypothetical protein
LQKQEQNYRQQELEMERNRRNEPPSYNCRLGNRVYGSGNNAYSIANCNPD